ncbi:DNA polymerase [Pseudoxanthomonas gei]|uniref:DNA polymerase n=1 Tax=Pseudoxanthomonas gei TaxID=1383030 RepID=A0ABX0ABF3_9GAMM|nr:DNA polymerase [Pseudoxanthomonas gei]NDK37957.1 DNA polymerase [Pseudoxanthomonas gei]
MTLRCLFVDFNSYFASVEQYDDPSLIGRPVGVVPVIAATTCCIAASVEAKTYGIGTGTPVWEALEKYPDLKLVQARPARYVELHHELMAAIGDCIPHGEPLSIDEVPCWLIGRERQRGNAEAIALRIKQTLVERGYSPAIRCSIGIAPNKFLAKTASDMLKPDGLTVLEAADLPDILHALELRDFCGIGPSMESRLRAAGIHTVQQLCATTREHLRAAWGSVEGDRFWLQLRGHDLPDRKTTRSSVGHSHVLGPELRNFAGMRSVLFKLLAKAAMRLRKDQYLARGLALRIRFVGLEARFERDLCFAPLDDTTAFLHQLGEQLLQLEDSIARGRWNPRRHPPLSVAVTLTGLETAGSLAGELMEGRRRARQVSTVLDSINRKYGNNAVYFGAMQQAIDHDAAPMRIPFAHVPETALEEETATRRRGAARSPSPSADELYLLRERQFKVMAENAHRESQKRHARGPDGARETAPAKAGAAGWSSKRKAVPGPDLDIGQTGTLF